VTTTYKNRYSNRGILDDEEINAGGLVARDLAMSLWLIADDQGRLTASVKWIWHQVFQHLEEVSLVRCKKAFEHLDEVAHFILLYEFDAKTYLQIRNWHRFQPQKVDRVRWSTLPAHPGWEPSIHLPKRLYEQWQEDKRKPGFSAPPISKRWISGGRPEPFRFRHVSGGGDEPEDERSQTVTHGGTLPARAPVDKGKSGQSGRSGRRTRGDIDQVGATAAPTQPAPDLATPEYAPTTSGGNGGPISWSDWPTLPVIKRRIHLTNWLFVKHGWQTVEAKTLEHEHAIADHIAELELDGDALHKHLEAWWVESDPDDRPTSLEYFWTRLQVLEGEHIKNQHRPHVRTDGFSKAADHLPDIQRGKA